MIYVDANKIGVQLLEWVSGACEYDHAGPFCVLGGGLRRQSAEVHDIEIVAMPSASAPRPEFGKPLYKTRLDQVLANLQDNGYLRFVKGQDKYKKYAVNTDQFGVAKMINPFHVEFWLVTPPAQWGVDLMIRTGPGKADNNFSQWIVTQQSKGGALPDGFRVKHAAVWRVEQFDEKDNVLKGEQPLPMPDEMSFFNFLGLPWIEPKDRRAMWRKR
jgi:DNA polymerase/3'-5' exonuclease PolX